METNIVHVEPPFAMLDILHCTNTMLKAEYLLQNYPLTRDDSRELWFYYLVVFHQLDEIIGKENFDMFKQLILDKQTLGPDMLMKAKSKFQKEGKYWGDIKIAQDKVDRKREEQNRATVPDNRGEFK
jgi:hypothetical protein